MFIMQLRFCECLKILGKKKEVCKQLMGLQGERIGVVAQEILRQVDPSNMKLGQSNQCSISSNPSSCFDTHSPFQAAEPYA